jgi:hypothetical protein
MAEECCRGVVSWPGAEAAAGRKQQAPAVRAVAAAVLAVAGVVKRQASVESCGRRCK